MIPVLLRAVGAVVQCNGECISTLGLENANDGQVCFWSGQIDEHELTVTTSQR